MYHKFSTSTEVLFQIKKCERIQYILIKFWTNIEINWKAAFFDEKKYFFKKFY